jgi:SAM-dependent methyltransferase
MVARALNLVGLDLGDEADLIEATGDNPDGYWEHAAFVALNDELLHELGGGWDRPVDVPGDLSGASGRLLRERAEKLVANFNGLDHWGWKDPRNSLTLPFWHSLLPDLDVVLIVRNPLEVAASLQRRGMFSYSLALELWTTYNERVLKAADDTRVLVTHYESYFSDPHAEIRRIGEFLGLPTTDQAIGAAVASIKADDRHARYTSDHLVEADVAPRIRELYRLLCELSGREADGDAGAGAPEALGDRDRKLDWNSFERLRRDAARTDARVAERTGSIKRLNWGCGATGEPGWINADLSEGHDIDIAVDIREGLPINDNTLDYIVSIHALPMIPYTDVVPVLRELLRMLKPGGVLRLGLPDLERGIAAYQRGDRSYFFVSDDDAQSLGGKFVTHMLWFGYSVTLFTPDFAQELLEKSGFAAVKLCEYRQTHSNFEGILDLDNRQAESFFIEGVKSEVMP